jgi:hypothetical protein
MPLNGQQNAMLQAKQRALKGLQNPTQATALLKQNNQQRGSAFIQQQKEMDANTPESMVIRQQALEQYPDLANHPQINQMSGEEIKQHLQQLKENQ